MAGERSPVNRRLVAEILEWAEPTSRNVELLALIIANIAPPERFNPTGLEQALHAFIDRLPLMVDEADDQALSCLVKKFNDFLSREPFFQRGECHVSKEFSWLASPALHAIDRLVGARSACALLPNALNILRVTPILRFWQAENFSEFKLSLGENVPRWQELNDLLYWTSVAEARSELSAKGQRLVEDWGITFIGHFWSFGADDFSRCLDWVHTREEFDDRLIALSRCLILYTQADKPVAWLESLKVAVMRDDELKTAFELWLNRSSSPVVQKADDERREWDRQRNAELKLQERQRADWVHELKLNPDRVIHPVGLKPGDFSRDQHCLLQLISTIHTSKEREDGSNWQKLIPEFGETVAQAFRNAAVAHWRAYRPGLRSEGAKPNSTPYSLLFGLVGLAIEAGEEIAFLRNLTQPEAQYAFRYTMWELNGFPKWFEPLYRAFPSIGLESVSKELVWELENSSSDQSLYYILYNIFYRAPWLHKDVAPIIFDWLCVNNMPNAESLEHCFSIMSGGGIATDALSLLSQQKIETTCTLEQRPKWFALWVDTDPKLAIPSLGRKLSLLPFMDASVFAEHFIVALLGDRLGTGTRAAAYRNIADLKTLYLLMHSYIKSGDDIQRAGRGVYSPTLRDNAQEARDKLFAIMASTPGQEAYAAMKALEEEHPEPGARPWMRKRALERATVDADEPPWTVKQVFAFLQGDSRP